MISKTEPIFQWNWLNTHGTPLKNHVFSSRYRECAVGKKITSYNKGSRKVAVTSQWSKGAEQFCHTFGIIFYLFTPALRNASCTCIILFIPFVFFPYSLPWISLFYYMRLCRKGEKTMLDWTFLHHRKKLSRPLMEMKNTDRLENLRFFKDSKKNNRHKL